MLNICFIIWESKFFLIVWLLVVAAIKEKEELILIGKDELQQQRLE